MLGDPLNPSQRTLWLFTLSRALTQICTSPPPSRPPPSHLKKKCPSALTGARRNPDACNPPPVVLAQALAAFAGAGGVADREGGSGRVAVHVVGRGVGAVFVTGCLLCDTPAKAGPKTHPPSTTTTTTTTTTPRVPSLFLSF